MSIERFIEGTPKPQPRPRAVARGELKPSAPRDHVKKPDVDNLAKAVLDALVDQGVIKDDSLVTRLEVAKEYANETEAGCLIKIKTA